MTKITIIFFAAIALIAGIWYVLDDIFNLPTVLAAVIPCVIVGGGLYYYINNRK